MARRTIKGGTRKVCLGDLNKRIELQERAMTEPTFGAEAEVTETFDSCREKWAKIDTVAGRTVFNGTTGRDVAVTHQIYVRHDATVTTETWVKLADGRRLDILLLENLDEDGEFMKLICSDKGASAKIASGV